MLSFYPRSRSMDDAEGGRRLPLAEDEKEALRLCKLGEANAFKLIVERYAGLLYGTALLMLRDRTAADDAVQEAFLAAWRSIDGFDTSRSLAPWLVRILVNGILQHRRKRWLAVVSLSTEPLGISVGQSEVEDSAVHDWERNVVQGALEALPPDAARLLILRFFAELTVPELAEILSVREGTIKSRLHRSLLKLRQELERRHAFE